MVQITLHNFTHTINAIRRHTSARGEFTLMQCDDAAIRQLNRDFRGFDKPTNVLSFPADEPDYLGDIAISTETVAREAVAQGKAYEAHFTHMLVHGVLHLLGHDHEDEPDAERMEALEINILKELGIDNPYLLH